MIKNCNDETMEIADDRCCRICLLFESEPRDTEALMLLKIAEEIPSGVLVPLGCNCRRELSLVHYLCALKWFDLKGLKSPCELCGASPSGISLAHRLKVRRFQFRGGVVMNNLEALYPELPVLDDETLARMVAFAELFNTERDED
ncbi:hypothetical protein TSUD_167860 [Trifolium subterraneum]|nr:hypothetical protein TSUD_167860 [Trifolium subterraneum]